jgi:hypothetical protein
MAPQVTFQAVGDEPPKDRYQVCRRMLIGPWCNQPEEYEGYNGFVGWMAMTILRSGRWLLTFSSGYWHASFPLTEELLKDSENLKFFQDMHKIGCPFVKAPRGGRCHIMYSDDKGLTWSKPETLIDTELDDRHPTILELDDGTFLCTYFDYAMPGELSHSAKYMLSHDGGKTWSRQVTVHPKSCGFGASPAIQLSDGAIVWVIEGLFEPKANYNVIGVFRSEDRGRSFQLAAVVNSGHEMNEPTVAELPDKRLVQISRRKDDIAWSSDSGRTWTEPVSFGVELFDPHLVMLPNGVLACFHGSYQTGGLRVILSKDFGRTWHGPMDTAGYCVDPSVYGYSAPVLLPDGTVYLAYIHSGGHSPADARTQAIWGIRVKINDNADGIEILPAPGSPGERGLYLTNLESVKTTGGDPELGELRRS